MVEVIHNKNYVLTMEEFNYDIVYVIQNREFSVLKKLVSNCYNFREKIAIKIEAATTYEIECIGKRTQNAHKISELQQELEKLKSEMDAIKLEQKVVVKKLSNAIKKQEELKEEVNDAKLKRDSLTLEMIDLQQESEKRKEHKVAKWNAIKLACFYYKQYLDFSIHLTENEEHEQIKGSFFVCDADMKDKYFVYVTNYDSIWRVETIEPVLKKEHLREFKNIVDFSKQSEISDLTAFLCKLRDIFVKYYLNTENIK
ncbi:uncharacterized protein LOC108632775 [Ceratina calcarata]|uniref:Uncharacterized protein LOC108632775 n=1 Tax=Ceratina calcarata TaxID=156304 RepID=A0AAJ7NFP7_9HYME|nr:uncharacterized protein LOC108632775 [Ceratina calcarata]